RVTFNFDDFVIKVQGLRDSGYDQNAGDLAKYKTIAEKNKKYFATPLSINHKKRPNYNGARKSVDLIAFERARPTTRAISDAQWKGLRAKFDRIWREENLTDVTFPAFGSSGHNMFIVDTPSGGFDIKIYDFGF